MMAATTWRASGDTAAPRFASAVLSAVEGNGKWPASLSHVTWDEINYATVGSNSKTILPGDDNLAEALFGYASRALDALGIRCGPAHFELMWIDGGPLLVEVGARLHGRLRPIGCAAFARAPVSSTKPSTPTSNRVIF